MNPTGAGPTNSTEFVELALPPLVAARYNDLITFDLGKLLRRLLRLESILGYMIEESEQWIDDILQIFVEIGEYVCFQHIPIYICISACVLYLHCSEKWN